MLMGFTVLQKTDGSFSFGPAFVKDLNMKEDDVEKGAKDLGKIFVLSVDRFSSKNNK